MHFGTSEGFVIDHFVGGHFDQRRACEENLRLILHKNGIIGHARNVGPTGRGISEHNRNGRNSLFGTSGDLTETGSAKVEYLGLIRKIGTRTFDQINARKFVLVSNFTQT